jgi:hypothetical protein
MMEQVRVHPENRGAARNEPSKHATGMMEQVRVHPENDGEAPNEPSRHATIKYGHHSWP